MQIYCAPSALPNDSAAVRRLLALAVREIYGIDMPEIVKTNGGKPYFSQAPHIHFSLSHSKEHVLCAIGESPIGADIEQIRQVSPKLIQRVCSDDEASEFDFFDLWVLKESYIKLKDAVNIPLREICFHKKEETPACCDSSVFSRLYHDLPGSPIGICSSDPDFPDKICFIPELYM